MKNELLENIAYENGLEYITTVEGGNNGYPRVMKGAIIGFDTYEQAEELARKHGLVVYGLHKRDGWQMYEREDRMLEAYKPQASWYGNDYSFYGVEDREDYFADNVAPFLSDFGSFDGVQNFLDHQKNIFDALQTIDETQIVVECMGEYYDTIEKETTAWSFDTHHYVIGVIEL